MDDDIPKWAVELIDTVSDLKEQTATNCKKLDTIQADLDEFKNEIPVIRVRLDTLCLFSKNNESHNNRLEAKIDALKKD